jgi:hypothetical protein
MSASSGLIPPPTTPSSPRDFSDDNSNVEVVPNKANVCITWAPHKKTSAISRLPPPSFTNRTESPSLIVKPRRHSTTTSSPYLTKTQAMRRRQYKENRDNYLQGNSAEATRRRLRMSPTTEVDEDNMNIQDVKGEEEVEEDGMVLDMIEAAPQQWRNALVAPLSLCTADD